MLLFSLEFVKKISYFGICFPLKKGGDVVGETTLGLSRDFLQNFKDTSKGG